MSRRKSSKKGIIAIIMLLLIAGVGGFAYSKISEFNPGGGGTGGDTPIVDNNGTPTAIIINETPIVF